MSHPSQNTAPETLGRLLMVDIPEPTLSDAWQNHLAKLQPGGVVLFRRNLETLTQSRALVQHLREILGPNVLIAIDQEGGGVWRTGRLGLPCAPSAMNLGAANDTALAHKVGAMVARSVQAIGANWCFGPVLDVNSNPHNPVIADRSFGENPERVAALGIAWAKGLQHQGVAGCAKHFPGHGDTNSDSHVALPRVERDAPSLAALELLPFRAAAQADIASIMTAHVIFPALDDLPATLSKRILTGLLREQWQYNGVIVTDAMDMQAISAHWGREEATLQSIKAGADMVEALGHGDMHVQQQSLAGLKTAHRAGELETKRVDDALQRLHTLSLAYPARQRDVPTGDHELAVHAWGQGISTHGTLALPAPGSSVLLVAPEQIRAAGASETGINGADLEDALRQAYRVQAVLYPSENPKAVLGNLPQNLGHNEAHAFFASAHPKRLDSATRNVASACQPNTHLCLWNPYNVLDVPAPAIITYGFRPEALAALVRFLSTNPNTGPSTPQAPGRTPVAL